MKLAKITLSLIHLLLYLIWGDEMKKYIENKK
jgi:hypothetical protein